MADPAFPMETAFVRGCAKAYASEIGFSPTAEAEMLALKVSWPAAHQALRNGRVVWSDKEEADDATSIVVGTDCDGDRLRLTLRWSADRYALLVVSVERV